MYNNCLCFGNFCNAIRIAIFKCFESRDSVSYCELLVPRATKRYLNCVGIVHIIFVIIAAASVITIMTRVKFLTSNIPMYNIIGLCNSLRLLFRALLLLRQGKPLGCQMKINIWVLNNRHYCHPVSDLKLLGRINILKCSRPISRINAGLETKFRFIIKITQV